MNKDLGKNVNVKLMSFGFKYRRPNANYYFDVSFLKNPARQTERGWSFFSPPDKDMVRFVEGQEQASQFIDHVIPLIEFLSEVDQLQVFGFGCNAGRHRSYVMVDLVAQKLGERGIDCLVEHVELGESYYLINRERVVL